MACWKSTQIVRCKLKQGAGFRRVQLHQAICLVSYGKGLEESDRLTATLRCHEGLLPLCITHSFRTTCDPCGSRTLKYLLCMGWQTCSNTDSYWVLNCIRCQASHLMGFFCSGSCSGQLFVCRQATDVRVPAASGLSSLCLATFCCWRFSQGCYIWVSSKG